MKKIIVLSSCFVVAGFLNISSLISTTFNTSLYADTLIYWEPEQRLTYDSIPQLHNQVWAYDSFVHILVNYDFPAMYLRSSDYGTTWSDTIRLNIESSTGFQTLIQQDSVVYFAWSENRDGPPGIAQVDTKYVFFRRSNDYGMTLDSAIFLGKGCPVGIDAKKESVFVTPVVGDPPPVWGPYLIHSFDGGLNWSAYLPIIDSAGQPNIAYRNGILYFAGCRDYKIIYTHSTDIGNTWATPTIITAPNTVLPKKPNLALGPNQDLYIAWTDNKFGGGMQFDDVMFRKSTDDGLTWGPEQRLTPDSHCDAGGALDMVSQDSMIFIVWGYNGLGVPMPCSVYFLASTDYGESWRERETIKGGFDIGTRDANVAVVQDYIYVIWRDNQYEERTPVSVSSVNVYPNPFSKLINISFGKELSAWGKEEETISSKPLTFSVKIYDITGKEVVVLGHQNIRESGYQGDQVVWDGRDKNDLQVPAGVYFVQVKAGNERVFKKAVKIE
jgi:hypothetical protein